MPVKHVFLTGVTGSVGSAVFPQLLARGFTVTALVRRQMQIGDCQTVTGSLENLRAASAAIAACDAIIHLASPRSVDGSVVLSQDIAGTAALIEAWRQGPFVYASSSTIYGYPLPALTETDNVDLWNWYDQSKFTNELQLRLAERQRGRGGAMRLRPALVFSANERRRDRQVLGDIYTQCQLGSRFVFESEEGLANYGCAFIGGNDLGVAIAEVLTRDLSGAFNLAGGFITWYDLIQTINKIAGTRGDFVIRPDTSPQTGEFRLPQSRTELDTTAFQQATGFQPRETLEEIVVGGRRARGIGPEEIVEAFVRAERAPQSP